MTAFARHPSPAATPARPILREYHRVREGVPEVSSYEDDVWNVLAAVSRENAKASDCKFVFEGSDGEQLNAALRAIIYARLNNDAPPFRKRIKYAFIREYGRKCRRFLRFMRDKRGIVELAKATQADIDSYHEDIWQTNLSADHEAGLLNVVADFYFYREHLEGRGLPFPPWGGRPVNRLVKAKRTYGENKTDRIDPPIIDVMIRWSLKYIDIYAKDIFSARNEGEVLKALASAKQAELEHLEKKQQRAIRYQMLERYLQSRAEQGRGVPVWCIARPSSRFALAGGHILNGALIHLQLGLSEAGAESVLKRHQGRSMLLAHAQNFGIELGGMDTPISIDPDTGLPWRSRFDAFSLRHEQRMLQAACYVLCAYLTGMRDSEVQAMRMGCVRASKSRDGLVDHYLLQSRVYKARREAGDIETWVTVEEVARAVAVLEKLSEAARVGRGGDTLWRTLDHHNRRKEHLSSEISLALRAFCEHINTLAGEDLIPRGPDGRVKAPLPSQFRRTIAWHIGNRPFGMVAGKLQFKQVAVATFEGYVGTSASGFPQEVEAERKLGQLDDILEYFEGHRRGQRLTGPAVKRITGVFEGVEAQLGRLPGQIVDAQRVKAMLSSLARTLHIGPLADCFFDAQTALCLTNAASIDGPQIAVCEPTKCSNACINERHAPAWQAALARAEHHLRDRRLSPLQRGALRNDAAKYQAVLKKIGGPKDGQNI